MSEKLSQPGGIAMLTHEDEFHMQQAGVLLSWLDEADIQLELPKEDERIEISHVPVIGDRIAAVFRRRHFSRAGQREDVYFGFRPDQLEVDSSQALSVVVDDLSLENAWIENGDFEKIPSRRQSLARKVAEGRPLESVIASHQQIVDFVRVLHSAISEQNRLRTS